MSVSGGAGCLVRGSSSGETVKKRICPLDKSTEMIEIYPENRF